MALNTDNIPGADLIAAIHQRLQSQKPFVIAGLGDSLTYGWMVQKGFFDRFVDTLETRNPSSAVTRINAGVPGDTADGGLMRLDKLLSQGPHVVTIQFGLNDMCHNIKEDEFQSTVESIVRRILKVRSIPVLVTSCPLRWKEGARIASAFYDGIRAAANSTDVPCASLDLYWQRIAGPPSQWDDLMQSDDVHPTDKGHKLMADGLFEAVMDSL
jgi:acyl-CoA thioesterase-1